MREKSLANLDLNCSLYVLIFSSVPLPGMSGFQQTGVSGSKLKPAQNCLRDQDFFAWNASL